MRGYFLVLLASCAIACGGSPAASGGAKGAHDADGGKGEVEVPRTVVTAEGASSIPELLKEAEALVKAERFQEAAAAYDRAYKLEPEGAYGDEAVWGAADAHDRANELELALSRYELYFKREATSPRGREAM